MINFVDRIPTQTGRRKITHADGTAEYVTVEMADNPTVEGTPLNRAAFMALQGFETVTTVFNTDGSITATNAAGDKIVTTVLENGNIQDKFTSADGSTITKTTTFNSDGSISEVLS